MEIKSLGRIDFKTIFAAFSNAFADYDIQLNADELPGCPPCSPINKSDVILSLRLRIP